MSVRPPVERRSRGRRVALLGLVPVAVVAVAAVSALAYWTTIGTGSAGAGVGTLAATAVTTHEASGTSVALEWDAVTPPAPDTVEYYVLRDGGTASASCGTATAPITAVGCTDTVPTSTTPTDYAYEVVAIWRSWTSTSASVDVHVKAAQTIVFTSTAPSGAKVGGATYAVTATGGGSGNAVTFSIDPSAAAVCSIAGSTVSFTAVGTCTVTANQAGSGDYEPAAAVQQSFPVAKGDQAIMFTSAAPSGAKVGGATYGVTATGGGSGAPVTFSIDPSAAAVCSIAGSTVSFTAVGTCTVTANQAGNTDWNGAPSAQQSFAVSKGDQAISFGALADRRFDESPVSVAATASSGLAVGFTSATPAVCSVAGASVTFVSVGTCTINADQGGSGNWNPAPQVQRSFQVLKGDQLISFAALADRRFDESPVSVAATASSGLTVTFTSATPAVCSVAGASVTFVSVGSCTINADQGGSGTWNPAPQVQRSFQVLKGNQVISFAAPADKRFDESLTVGATASSGLAVSFTSATPTVCTTGGTNGATIAFVSTGTCTINADQGGSGNWNPALQVQRSFQVLKGNQVISFAAPADRRFDESLTVAATASSGLTVTFTSATPGVCSVSGASVTFVSVGTCTVGADQVGDGNWNPAPQVQPSFQVLKGNQAIALTSTAPSGATAGGASYTATATASSGLVVTFGTGSPAVCTSGGTNGATFGFTAIGTCIVNATQAGNANWNAAAPVAQTFSVGKASPTLTVSAPATATVGSGVAAASITATLASSSGPNATASITFRVFGPQSTAPTTCASGGTTVGTATPAGNGTYQSSASFTPSGAGTYWWYVSSPSDTNNNAAASACNSPSMTQTVVTAAATRLSFTSCSTSAGSSANCATAGTATVTLKKANQGGGTWTARVTLMDASGNPMVNTTGSTIVVSVSKTNASAVLTFSTGTALTIPNGSSESSNTFTYDNTGVSNGNGSDTVTGASTGFTSAIGNVTW